MTTFLKRIAEQPTELEPAEAQPPSYGETVGAARRAEAIETDTWSYAHRRAAETFDEMLAALGPDYAGPELRAGSTRRQQGSRRPDYFNQRVTHAAAEIARRRAEDPTGPWGDLPNTREEFEQSVTDSLRAEYDDAARTLEQGPLSAELLGRMLTAAIDESTIATLPIGLAARAGVIGTAAITAGEGAAAEVLTLPRQYAIAERLEIGRAHV